MTKWVYSALVGLAVFFGATSASFAQCGTQGPGGTVCGNRTGSLGLNGPLTNPVLGIAGTSKGQIGLTGNTSGTATIMPQAVAGTPTLTLPNTSGTFAVGSVSPLTLDSASGQLSITGLAGAILAGSPPAFTRTPTLGVAGTAQGTLGFAGLTSGTVTLAPQSVAGSPTLTLPNTSGTLAAGASSPLVLSATTGNLTCPTCVTSSGGGAITGVAPINVSAAGAVSLQGATGTVATGSGGTGSAFTATPALGVAGSVVGTLSFANATSGSVTIQPAAGALGTAIATLPAGTYNIVGDSISQTLTNKTISGGTFSGTIAGTPSFSGAGFITLANIVTGSVDTALGYWGSTVLSATSVPNCAVALTYSTTTHTYGCNTATGGTVTQVNSGTGLTGGPITTTGTLSLSPPIFSGYMNAASQTVTSGTFTVANIDTVVVDSNSWFNVTTHLYTPQVAGTYLMTGKLRCTGTAAQAAVASVAKNGTEYARGAASQPASGAAADANIAVALKMNGSTDTMSLFALCQATGTAAFAGGTGPLQTYMHVQYIGP